MKVEGTTSFAAPRQTVWDVLNDPAQMAKTMPNVESFDILDERRWRANVSVRLGLGALKLAINFDKTEERAPEFARLHAKGQGVGALLSMDTQFELAEAGGGTEMRWEADVQIAGPVGAMGQRVIQPIVNQQVKQVLAALDKQVQAAAAAGGSDLVPPPEEGVPRLATPEAGGFVEREAVGTPPQPGFTGGTAGGAAAVRMDVEPETDPELKDYGPPAESSPEADPASVEGSSGAEEGISPWAPEGYTEEPEGPTSSTESRRAPE